MSFRAIGDCGEWRHSVNQSISGQRERSERTEGRVARAVGWRVFQKETESRKLAFLNLRSDRVWGGLKIKSISKKNSLKKN